MLLTLSSGTFISPSREAVEYLLGSGCGTLTASPIMQREPPPFTLPKRNDNMRRVYAYLISRRGIDRDVVNAFAYRQMIYESAEYHNAVFVGFDSKGIPRHANLRGTGAESTFKGNAPGSIPEYSFHWTGSEDTLFLFEAPIDLLSFISLHKDNWAQPQLCRLLRCGRSCAVSNAPGQSQYPNCLSLP